MRRGLLLLGAALLLAGCDPKGVYDGRPAPGTVTLGSLLCPPAFALNLDGPELFENGDCEAALPSIAGKTPVMVGSWALGSDVFVSGSKSLQLTTTTSVRSYTINSFTNTGYGFDNLMGMVAGKMYRLRANVYANGTPQSTTVGVLFARDGTTITGGLSQAYPAVASSWNSVLLDFTVPPDVTQAQIKIQVTSGSGTPVSLAVDDLSLRELVEASPSPCPSPTPVPSSEPSSTPVPSSEPSPLPSGEPTPAPGGGSGDSPQYLFGFTHDQAKERLLQMELWAKWLLLPEVSLLLVWVFRRKVYML